MKRRRPSSKDGEDPCCPMPLDASLVGPDENLVEGLGVFCLHQSDPRWFQGYFFQNTTETAGKPWGILAVQEELDDCMWSADGGYRRCSLTLFPYPAKRKIQIPGVEWTGGDMIRLSNEKVSLNPDQLMTGKHAVPQVEKLFGGIVEKCRKGLEEGEPSSVLDVLPNVVVVSGPMKLVVPKKLEDGDA